MLFVGVLAFTLMLVGASIIFVATGNRSPHSR
jgi:hypothetical protein